MYTWLSFYYRKRILWPDHPEWPFLADSVEKLFLMALYMATEIVASGLALGEPGAQVPECTTQFTATRPRMPSTARPRCQFA